MTDRPDRRRVLGGIAATAFAVFAAPRGALAASPLIMWRDPNCGCCLAWAERAKAELGREVKIVPTTAMDAIKRTRGVPAALHSCHTSVIDGYVIEGHVPPADIQQLVRSGNRRIKGLAVPGMPLGSPGMDVGHDHSQAYDVIAFAADGRTSIFASHS